MKFFKLCFLPSPFLDFFRCIQDFSKYRYFRTCSATVQNFLIFGGENIQPRVNQVKNMCLLGSDFVSNKMASKNFKTADRAVLNFVEAKQAEPKTQDLIPFTREVQYTPLFYNYLPVVLMDEKGFVVRRMCCSLTFNPQNAQIQSFTWLTSELIL